jgi:hypothetical protein
MLCRISTGGGLGLRKLFTDDTEMNFHNAIPLIINGIEISLRADLADRAITLNLTPIPKAKRKSKNALICRFEELLPRILGALYDAVSAALKNQGTISNEDAPRMASCTDWIIAAETELPWEQGGFMEAYRDNIDETVNVTLDSDPVAEAVLQFIEGKPDSPWAGTATELLGELEKQSCVTNQIKSSSEWPKVHNKLTQHLKRIVTFLRSKDIELAFERNAKGRIITITKMKSEVTTE